MSLTKLIAGMTDDSVFAANKNISINGNFAIWQRGTSFSPGANLQVYTVDRWFMNRNGVSDWTVSRQGTVEQYSCRIQRDNGTPSTQPMRARQILESADCGRMANNIVTVSFDMKVGANFSSTSNNVTLSIISGTGIDESSTTLATGLTGAVTVSESHSGTTSYVRYNTSTATLGASVTQLGILFQSTPVGTAGADDWFEIRNVQIEIGSVATEFERRSFAQELAMAQRYYTKTFATDQTPAEGAGFSGAPRIGDTTNNLEPAFNWVFSVAMRTSPTIALYNPRGAGTNAQWDDGSSNGSNARSTSTNDHMTTIDNTNIKLPPSAWGIHATADAEL